MRIENLAVNKNGFAFDPTSGEAFTLNETAKEIIEDLARGVEEKEIAKKLSERDSEKAFRRV